MLPSMAFVLTVIASVANVEASARSRRLLASFPYNSSVIATLPFGMPSLAPYLPSTLGSMNISSCTYSPIDGTCTANNNLLLKKGAISSWSKIRFAGR